MRATALLSTMTALSQPVLADDDIFDLGVIEVNAEAEKASRNRAGITSPTLI